MAYDDVILRNTATTGGGAWAASQLTGVYAGSNWNPGVIAFASDSGPLFNDGTNWQRVQGFPSASTPISRFIWPQEQLSTIVAFGNATASFQYVPTPNVISGSRIDALVSWSGASSATTNTCAFAVSAYAAIYSNSASSLVSLSSGSTQTTYSYASNSAGVTALTAGAMRPISVPVNFSMSAGEYYVGFNIVTATSSIGLSTTNLGQSISVVGGVALATASNYAEFTANTATSSNLYGAMGLYSVATTGLSGNYALSLLNMTGANLADANIALVFRNY